MTLKKYLTFHESPDRKEIDCMMWDDPPTVRHWIVFIDVPQEFCGGLQGVLHTHMQENREEDTLP